MDRLGENAVIPSARVVLIRLHLYRRNAEVMTSARSPFQEVMGFGGRFAVSRQAAGRFESLASTRERLTTTGIRTPLGRNPFRAGGREPVHSGGYAQTFQSRCREDRKGCLRQRSSQPLAPRAADLYPGLAVYEVDPVRWTADRVK